MSNATTPPGGQRESAWLHAPDRATIRVTVRRGYDCRLRCEHTRPLFHGPDNYRNDEWIFDYRSGDVAAVIQCFSHLRNGVLDNELPRRREADRFAGTPQELRAFNQTIYGARVIAHRQAAADDGHACPVFGRCTSDFLGYLFSSQFFEQAHSDVLEPLASRPVDEIDLAAIADAMSGLWIKLAVVVGVSASIGE
jgi:hypothetical protein